MIHYVKGNLLESQAIINFPTKTDWRRPSEYSYIEQGLHVLYHLNGSYIKGMGGMDARPFDYIWLLDDTEAEAWRYIDESGDASLRTICEKARQLLRGYYSNYSLELLSSVDYLLQTVPALSSWQTDDRNQVLDTLMQEVQHWSRRKEQMFPRNLLAQAVDYLQQQQTLFEK